ncbi:hypothetical protein RND71_016667 [Anisodus tanguticus]|uniref:APO domain-containing protein n=1 Tax=Anisodus tanguticus TaxID=243964 RepID=A0AAE1S6L7_9SOLA|nr:hypothetical protein RND71_016667 [Anisodus tanguticus]
MDSAVDGVGNPIPTSAVLMSASKHIDIRCRSENVAYLKCKKDDPNPEKCLQKGQQVTRCVLSLLKDLHQRCNKEMDAYAGCMYYNTNEFEMCRACPGVVVYKKPLQWANPLLLKFDYKYHATAECGSSANPAKKKKPYPIPLKKIQQAARSDKKLAESGIEKKLEPSKNGLLVPDLIPVAYGLLDDWKLLIKGLAQLLHFVPVHACSSHRSFHSWVKGSINDVLIPFESYHMYDPFGTRIKHETRFNYDKFPAVVELCIQAGVDLPGYPSRRRTKPIRMIGKKVIDIGGLVEEPRPSVDRTAILDLDTHRSFERFDPPLESELVGTVRRSMWGLGVTMLSSVANLNTNGGTENMAGKMQLWMTYFPQIMWHVQDPKGPPLRSALKRFYGKAPAVVEVCMQAGAQISQKYKPMMRLDIVLPESEESRLVA